MGTAAALGLIKEGMGRLGGRCTGNSSDQWAFLTHHSTLLSNSEPQVPKQEGKLYLLLISEKYLCLQFLVSFVPFSLHENVHTCKKRPVGESDNF